MEGKRRIGILGFGSVARYFVSKINRNPNSPFIIDFVWARNSGSFLNDADELADITRLSGENLSEVLNHYLMDNEPPSLMVELCHPQVIAEHALFLLKHSDLYIASITALADQNLVRDIKTVCKNNHKSCYIPVGAAWGVPDIIKLNRQGYLTGIEISMKFNADALKLESPLKEKLEEFILGSASEILLYRGSVTELALLAPNNVNTMMCISLAADSLSSDAIVANLYAQKEHGAHITEIDVMGVEGFKVSTVRYNPAKKSAVTGDQTYLSFYTSLELSHDGEHGLNFV